MYKQSIQVHQNPFFKNLYKSVDFSPIDDTSRYRQSNPLSSHYPETQKPLSRTPSSFPGTPPSATFRSAMEERLKLVVGFMVMLSLFSFNLKQSLCLALNDEGLVLLMVRDRIERDPFGGLSNWRGDGGVVDHCSWFGVECSDGKVVSLNLKDLCLQGTLPPEIGKLTHIKSIILRNNSFSGEIPEEIQQLKELEILDLGYNNFSGSFPSDLTKNPSLTVLLLDNNDYLANLTPEVYQLKTISEFHANEEQLTGASTIAACGRRSGFGRITQHTAADRRQLLQTTIPQEIGDNENLRLSPSSSPSSLPPDSGPFLSSPLSISPSEPPSNSPSASAPSPFVFLEVSPSQYPFSNFLTPSPVEAPTPGLSIPANPPVVSTPSQYNWVSAPSPSLSSGQENTKSYNSKHQIVIIWSTVGSFSFLILASCIAFAFFRNSKVVTVKPWATGLSGQLQKAFVTGVPNLKRAEIIEACEDFSNIIESLEDIAIYKGTLSSGVEIAVVVPTAVTSSKNWSKHMESQFRNKIETLSRVNHKNFVNLIGFCEEKKPFTRMLVFEYAPNGTLFEHLHIKESEHLDWGMRMRIAMGIAFCLEHMHQLTPSIALRNLLSSSVYLTEDFAAKISDLSFWNEIASAGTWLGEISVKDNVYSFGMLLFELITGRIPYIVDNGLVIRDWVLEYLRVQPLRDLVDPTLNPVQLEEVDKWSQVIKDCMNPNSEERPTMREITAKLKEITGIEADGAAPKLSPLWWAELEILSPESS
ncbi:hypothetical protein L6164_028706 [Bauhinia variegata]|uniref:Uncharacterized protein n=1 Tax=Bauhinia variegata TaxID=167791 RepID=A0ACB9L6H1_BAUVA|nr:hypothetical protein L6164_028706 [Bauhinia variegata]